MSSSSGDREAEDWYLHWPIAARHRILRRWGKNPSCPVEQLWHVLQPLQLWEDLCQALGKVVSQSALYCALCTLQQKLSIIIASQCSEEMHLFLLKRPFPPCQGGSGKCPCRACGGGGAAAGPMQCSSLPLTVLPPVWPHLEGPLSQGRAAGGCTGLSVMPRAPLRSHGVGGSMAPLLLPFMWGCAWAKLPLSELPGGWAVPLAAMAKQGCHV